MKAGARATSLFACDIDNTIIYSRRKPHAGFLCVEWLQGAEQAYMSPATIRGMAAALKKHLLIPVTSRSMEQYRRLRFPEGCEPEWSVTANGADLLRKGEADGDWRAETQRLIAAGSKLYLLPEKLNKGTAVERLQRRVSQGLLCGGDSDMEMADAGLHRKADAVERLRRRSFGGLICAGDSEMDLPMLEMADAALLPRSLRPLWHGRGSCEVPEEGELFSEFVFQRALAVLKG